MKVISKENLRITLRKADISDKEDLLAWRNDLLTRANSFHPEWITEKEHERWFAQAIQDKNKLLLVGYQGKKKFGVVRYNRVANERYEVSINLDPAMRGQGLGAMLLRQSLPWVKGRITARIKKANVISIRAFEKAGYQLKNEDKEAVILEIDNRNE